MPGSEWIWGLADIWGIGEQQRRTGHDKTRVRAHSFQGKDDCLTREGNRSVAEKRVPPREARDEAIFLGAGAVLAVSPRGGLGLGGWR